MFLGIVDEIRNFKGFFRCSSLFVAVPISLQTFFKA